MILQHTLQGEGECVKICPVNNYLKGDDMSENTMMNVDVEIGAKYRHFKGGEYVVVAVAKDSENLEPVVVYRALYGEGQVWVRPLSMFVENVERDGYNGPRFVQIDE